jgi:hypothetical protein
MAAKQPKPITAISTLQELFEYSKCVGSIREYVDEFTAKSLQLEDLLRDTKRFTLSEFPPSVCLEDRFQILQTLEDIRTQRRGFKLRHGGELIPVSAFFKYPSTYTSPAEASLEGHLLAWNTDFLSKNKKDNTKESGEGQ